MKQALLIAHPAGHSLSPAMHNAAFEHVGIDAVYRSVDVPPMELGDRVASLRDPSIWGANVTIPHKEAVLPLMDRLTDAARAIGAVNTIVVEGNELVGDNTDAGGFLRAVAEAGIAAQGANALVIGAGGAARAVAYGLTTGGAASVAVYNRTEERAARLAADLAEFGDVQVVGRDDLPLAGRAARLLVNATSVGMEGTGTEDELPCPVDALPSAGAVVDIVYRPARTPLLRAAAKRGLVAQNGVAMLVHQGAAAFELWTGRTAPVDVMRGALERALAAREA